MVRHISVVVPCRNEHERLRRCLDALEAQDYPRSEFEIIVVDGASSDGSGALALHRGLTLLVDEGRGPAAARNLGIRRARGDIVAFTDADCVPRFDWLTRLAAAFRADPQIGGIAGALRLPRETLLGRLEDNDARLCYRGYITSSVAYRRDVLASVGGFDEALRCAEDYDLAWRVLDAGHRIGREPRAIVLHDPPEVDGSLGLFLAKQFWYARHDVPAHVRALRRSPVGSLGRPRAVDGSRAAVSRSAWTLGAGAALLPGGRPLAVAALATLVVSSARHVSRTVAAVGEGAREIPRLALVEATKRLARGAGTLVGLADLARPSVLRSIRSPAPEAWSRVSPVAAQPSRAQA